MDKNDVVHLIYLTGDPARADILYTRSSDGGSTWAKAVRVNSQPGSAIAIGTVRGPHLAIGRNGRVHVAWMGSSLAQPKAPDGTSGMLYTHLSSDGAAFEPQRNVITTHSGLDGGASIAADDAGHVFVAWHAPEHRPGTEQDRRVWVARSTDDGKSFAPEACISDPATGACACCGMRIMTADGKLFVLYRGASEQVNRGMFLIDATSELTDAHDRQIAPMKIGMCVMSTASLAGSQNAILAAWETHEQVVWSALDPAHPEKIAAHRVAPSDDRGQKHPAIASNASGQVLVAWAEGTGWNKGGSVAWQLFDASGSPLPEAGGQSANLPVWGSPAVFAKPGGGFVIVY